jgi:hypothetical protein
VRGEALARDREDIGHYAARMQGLEAQLISLSLSHSKVIKKKRRAEQMLSQAIRQAEEAFGH